MKLAVLYLHIVKKSDPNYPVQKDYAESTDRFIHTYKAHHPVTIHDLVIAHCGGYADGGLFRDIADDEFTIIGNGYDNGSYQEMNRVLMCYDLVLALNTHAHFWRDGWLEPIAEAARKHGIGVYGISASRENHPHLRTPAIAYHPGVMAEYPLKCRTRGDCCLFEAGPDNFSLWAHRRGFPSMLVTADGDCWPVEHWRKPPNIFRRGDQSNVLIWDRHTDIYAAASPEEKAKLEKQSDWK
jgi:hypothetical protein